jgi:hypothetical protein
VSLGSRAACSEHGECALGTCTYDPGFHGSFCHLSTCPQSWSDRDCSCCPSGVLASDGTCCNSTNITLPILDAGGACCAAGWVDAKGVCGGECTAADRSGACCQSGFLDATFSCCENGTVDEVCPAKLGLCVSRMCRQQVMLKSSVEGCHLGLKDKLDL